MRYIWMRDLLGISVECLFAYFNQIHSRLALLANQDYTCSQILIRRLPATNALSVAQSAELQDRNALSAHQDTS
jgi:hypothetical protein